MSDTIGSFGPKAIVTSVAVTATALVLLANVREPKRQQYNAIALAVAAGTYLNGGLGPVEMPCTVAIAICAANGLQLGRNGYRYMALGWILHTVFDVLHHMKGLPMVDWIPTSSAECAMTDSILAGWMLMGAPGFR